MGSWAAQKTSTGLQVRDMLAADRGGAGREAQPWFRGAGLTLGRGTRVVSEGVAFELGPAQWGGSRLVEGEGRAVEVGEQWACVARGGMLVGAEEACTAGAGPGLPDRVWIGGCTVPRAVALFPI